MFYLFYEWFHQAEGPLRFLRLFKSQTFRALCAAATGFAFLYLVMPWFIRLMRRHGLSEQTRHYSELDAGRKASVPTMGGLVVLPAIILSALLWCDPRVGFVPIALGAGLVGGLLGLADDVSKLRGGGSDRGLSRGVKYAAQAGLGLALAAALLLDGLSPIASEHVRGALYFPGDKYGLYLGAANALVVVFFMVLATNAVNLTDGMDGLASVPSVLVFLVLAVFAYVIGRVDLAAYLQFFPYADECGEVLNHHLPGAGELAVLCCAGAGAVVGFLWFNAFPATVMMGDTGALGLGAMLGAAAVLIRQEFVFIIAGGVFMIESGSAFIQDYIGLKLLGRRIFFRAPFHSAWLHRGVSENKVTVRLWILSAAFAAVALALLKLR
ncbi:MAG: phospho-N-acetylmuramoyl-pentapeptide-transferase [Planctomycetota bacterium]